MVRPTLIYDMGVCDHCSRVVVFKKTVDKPLCPNCDVMPSGPSSNDVPPDVKRAIEEAMKTNPQLAKMMQDSWGR